MTIETTLQKELQNNVIIHERIAEYLGASETEEPTTVFITKCDTPDTSCKLEPTALGQLLQEESAIARSLWDRKFLLFHLDIDYVNFDDPARAFFDPRHAFRVQKAVEVATEELLREFDIPALHLISGRGHHFVWQIAQSSSVFAMLAALGNVSPELQARYAQPCSPRGEVITAPLYLAYSGLGKVAEYLAHLIKVRATQSSSVPVVLTAIAVEPGEEGREAVSLDISEYADPLQLRVVRIPFTLYSKGHQLEFYRSHSCDKGIPPRAVLPLFELSTEQALVAMTEKDSVIELARRAPVHIPISESGTENLIKSYLTSSLYRCHEWFYSEEHDPYFRWRETYDLFDINLLPPCAQRTLRNPNPALVIPAGIELLTRSLLALGWHPRHIAGLIRSKYERDFGWGSYWFNYDAALRADFYVRIVTGLFYTGIDNLRDYNSESTIQKGLASQPTDCQELDQFRDSLFARRTGHILGTSPDNQLVI